MNTRSAVARTFGLAALLVALAACPAADPTDLAAKAEAAWDLYRSHPATGTYENFIRANRNAAAKRTEQYDRTGITYQVRSLEAMSEECERRKDAALAEDVTSRIAWLEQRDLIGNFEETVPGSKERLAAAKARAAAVGR